MTIKFSNPTAMPPSHGYSQVVEYLGGGKMVFISGQVAADTEGSIIGKGSLEEQAHQVFKNIETALAAAGGKVEHLVKLNTYLKDITKISTVRKIRDLHVNTKNPPASTTVQAAFDKEDILVEIDAIAIIPI